VSRSDGQRRFLVIAAVAILAAGLFSWLATVPPDESPTRTTPRAHTAGTTAPGSSAVASDQEEPPPSLDPGAFANGFCAPNGEDGTITIHHTLPRLLAEESDRRLAAMPEAAREEVLGAVDGFVRSGQVPSGLSSTDVLMAASQRGASPERLLEAAEQASHRDPRDPFLQVAKAIAADRLGQHDVELEAVRRARRGLPKDPALGWTVAVALRDTPALDEAISGLDAYLAVDPLPALARLRARMIVQRHIQRDYRHRTKEGVTLLWPDGVISETQADSILGSIAEALDGAAKFLGVPRRANLMAVAFPSRSEMLAVTCVRGWAGAVYDGTLRLVLTPELPSGVPLEQLRHETTHATLSPAAPRAPLWFDEGVAQVYARQRDRLPLWRMMLRNRTWIPFGSLDGSFHIFDRPQDADLAYAESQALVELMRDRGGERAIPGAVRDFKEGLPTATVLAHATGQTEVTGEDLLTFLGQRLSAEPR
jgi:hypothetical protein